MVQKIAAGQTELIPRVTKEYNDLHQTTTDIRLDVEKNLRKIRTGGVPYSPRLQRYRDTISYWERIVKLKKSVSTSRNQLKRLATKLHLFTGFHVTLEFAQEQVRAAYQDYFENAKPFAIAWRDHHNQSLLEALVLEGKPGNQSESMARAQIRREKQQHEDGLAAKAIRARNNKAAVLMVEIEGDPAAPQIEAELQRCLAKPAVDGFEPTPTDDTVPTAALESSGLATLWFDAQRYFGQLPKNAAAQARYQQLQRHLDFELMLRVPSRKTVDDGPALHFLSAMANKAGFESRLGARSLFWRKRLLGRAARE